MTMFTRCPSCSATFRVTLEHLQASAGQVRCGVCQTVFDAFVSLSAADPRPGAAAPVDSGAPAQPPAGGAGSGTGPTGAEQILPRREVPEPGAVPATRSSARVSPASAVQSTVARLPASAADSALATPRQVIPSPVMPGMEESSVGAQVPRRSAAWIAVVVLLAIAGAGQGAYFLRTELAARVPALRPWLERACASLGCQVPMPRATDQLSIEGSDLQALDPARPGRVLLTATIRNRAPFAQPWPMLEITLTNARDQAVIRRVFSAAEYLAPVVPGPGMEAGAEASIQLRLEAQDLQPAGYRLYLFHP